MIENPMGEPSTVILTTNNMTTGGANEADMEPVKRKRGGRVKGSKNKPKTQPEQPVTEPEAKSLREFISEITTGEEFRESLKTRLKSGKLSPGESRLVEKILDAPVEKKKEGWQELLAVATEDELVLLADLMRRAIAARGVQKAKRVQTRKPQRTSASEERLSDGEPSVSEQLVFPGVLTAEKLPSAPQALSNQVLSSSEPGR